MPNSVEIVPDKSRGVSPFLVLASSVNISLIVCRSCQVELI